MANNLPQGWIECKLGDVLKYEQPTRYIVKSTNYDDFYNTPVLTAGKSFIIGYTNETEGVCNNLPVIIFDDFTTSSQYVDFSFKVKSSAMKILHATEDVNIKYMYYIMRTIQHKAVTHKRYWISEYSQRKVKIPVKLEQDKIVENIEEKFAKIDKGIEKFKLTQEKVDHYKQSVLRSAFEGKLYKTTEWEYKNLGSIFETSSGGTPKRNNPDYYGGVIPWLKSGELNNGLISEAEEYITDKGLNNSSAKIFPRGSVLIALYGATVGKLGILDFDSATNQAICCIYQNENYNRDFLFNFLLLKKEFLVNQGKGGAQPNISQEIIKALVVPIPTLDEQKQIVKEIEKRFEIADKAEKVIAENLEKAEQLKQSILKKAFEGRLIPQDPNDEPATELLAKIQAERKTKT